MSFLTIAAVAVLCERAGGASLYYIQDLGVLPGQGTSVAYAVSQNGSYAAGTGDGVRAFQWAAPFGPMVNLGTLGGGFSGGEGVNNAGKVVGSSATAGGQGHGFLYNNGGPLVDLGTLGGQTSNALGINNLVQPTIVGQAQDAGGNQRAYRWSQTQLPNMQSLGVLPGDTISLAHGVNDANQICGFSTTAGGNQHAFRWTPAAGGVMTPLGTLPGGTSSSAYAISSAGDVTGSSNALGVGQRAYLWTPAAGGTFTPLGALPGDLTSTGHGVNAAQEVIGLSGVQNPFVWTQFDGMLNLNDLIDPSTPGAWNLMDATAINDQGVVAGDGLFNGTDHAFLATPVAIAPEPSGGLLAVGACFALLGKRKRRDDKVTS